MTSSVLIEAHGLGKCYDVYPSAQHRLLDQFLPRRWRQARPFWALQNVDFRIALGESVGIVGRNGSGKSTLLQLICGTLTPTTGSVSTYGRVAALLELGAGFNPEFDGIENVRLNAAILGMSSKQIDERLDSILAFADIGEFVHQPVKHYSSGMFLRLAFAVVAHVDADILIIDEALAVGDAVFTQKCMRFLRDFKKRGALLFVSHDVSSVTALCDRALWLDHGQLRMGGSAKEVTEAYLEHIYSAQQAIDGTAAVPQSRSPLAELPRHDMRRDFLMQSPLRNDIRVDVFDPQTKGFGSALAAVTMIALLDTERRPLAWVVGGEEVILRIEWMAHQAIERVSVGFMLKNRHGQVLFGDNTLIAYRDKPMSQRAGAAAHAEFRFRLPFLPSGQYSISTALASGTQDQHVLHQWVHEALILHCESSHAVHGLLGVPMASISMEVEQ
ncbi:MAG: ABC transporter ATP-binding protein [Burkholderiales bacterium]|nr:ABC transporter ATP-binding protein [Burkholderiales bacterium]